MAPGLLGQPFWEAAGGMEGQLDGSHGPLLEVGEEHGDGPHVPVPCLVGLGCAENAALTHGIDREEWAQHQGSGGSQPGVQSGKSDASSGTTTPGWPSGRPMWGAHAKTQAGSRHGASLAGASSSSQRSR